MLRSLHKRVVFFVCVFVCMIRPFEIKTFRQAQISVTCCRACQDLQKIAGPLFKYLSLPPAPNMWKLAVLSFSSYLISAFLMNATMATATIRAQFSAVAIQKMFKCRAIFSLNFKYHRVPFCANFRMEFHWNKALEWMMAGYCQIARHKGGCERWRHYKEGGSKSVCRRGRERERDD